MTAEVPREIPRLLVRTPPTLIGKPRGESRGPPQVDPQRAAEIAAVPKPVNLTRKLVQDWVQLELDLQPRE